MPLFLCLFLLSVRFVFFFFYKKSLSKYICSDHSALSFFLLVYFFSLSKGQRDMKINPQRKERRACVCVWRNGESLSGVTTSTKKVGSLFPGHPSKKISARRGHGATRDPKRGTFVLSLRHLLFFPKKPNQNLFSPVSESHLFMASGDEKHTEESQLAVASQQTQEK